MKQRVMMSGIRFCAAGRRALARPFQALGMLALLALGAAGLSCAPEPPVSSGSDTDSPRGVILISIDTLRADHVSSYGYPRLTTPFLDEVAAAGTLFESAVSSAPWTLPAHASMLTGLYPSSHRGVEGSEGIADTTTLAAEMFQEAGYATGGFVASWFVSQRYGFQRGFDVFDDFQQTLQNNTKQKIPAEQVVNAAGAWLKENGDDPFFLFVHLYDAHFNYNPPAEHAALFDTGYTGKREPYRKYVYYKDNPVPDDLMAQEIAMYDGEIHYLDSQLRRLDVILQEMGLAEDVVVMITSDHGEEFFERDSWGHAHTLYEEVIRVPLIVRGPGLKAGQRWPGQVRHVDMLPTLIDFFALDGPSRLHGSSLRSILEKGEDPGPLNEAGEPSGQGNPRPAFMETSRFSSNMIGVRRDGWKVILNLVKDTSHLLHLAEDPGEVQDLAASRPDDLAAMTGEVMASAAMVVPDRWLLRWYADQEAPLSGRITTEGQIYLARNRGEGGTITVDADGAGLTYDLPPGGVLEFSVLPVDVPVHVEPPVSGDRTIALALGREGHPAPAGPLEASSHQAGMLTGIPTPLAPAAAFWLEQSRGGGSTVFLSEDEIRRLESLGYVMR